MSIAEPIKNFGKTYSYKIKLKDKYGYSTTTDTTTDIIAVVEMNVLRYNEPSTCIIYTLENLEIGGYVEVDGIDYIIKRRNNLHAYNAEEKK